MSALTGIPENVRKWIYIGYAVFGVAFGAIQVAYTTGANAWPNWLKISVAVYAFLGTAFGMTARAHMPAVTDIVRGEGRHVKNENGYTTGEVALLALAVLGLVLLVLVLVGVLH